MTDLALSNSLADLAARISAEHEAAENAYQCGVEHALQCGALLLEAKEQVPHGQWLPWLQTNCSVSPRSARLYMQLARSRPELESKTATVANLTLRDALNSTQRAIKHLQLEERRASYTLENPQVMLPAPDAKRKISIARNKKERQWMLAIGPSISRAALLQKEQEARGTPTVRNLQEQRDDLLAQAAALEQQIKEMRDEAAQFDSHIDAEINAIIGPVQPLTETCTFQADKKTDAALAKLAMNDLAARLVAARSKKSNGLKLCEGRGDVGYWGDMNLRGASDQVGQSPSLGWTGVGSPEWLNELFGAALDPKDRAS